MSADQTPGGGDSTGSATGSPTAPGLVIVLGPAGSGKSLISQRLAHELRAVYLDKDRLAGPLSEALLETAGADAGARDEHPFYLEAVMDREYEALLAVASDNLAPGRTVVIDAPFARYLADPAFIERLRDSGRLPADARITVVTVRVDPAVRRSRLERRDLGRDAWKLANWELASKPGPECTWRGVELVEVANDVDGELALTALLDGLAERLR